MILQRIKQYLDYRGIATSAFEKSIGMGNASFGKSLKSGGTIGANKLEIILKTYPELNPTWLITGEGEMLKESTINNSNVIINKNVKNSGNIDNRQYYSDSPDVLRAQIELLDERIKEKDAQIKEKDAQIKEKDAQINSLLSILGNSVKK